MPTVQGVFAANQAHLRPVPIYQRGDVCNICRGPVKDGFVACWACNQLRRDVPFTLAGAVVPMSVAPNPGPWYTRLATYKTFHPEHSTLLASLTYLYLAHHESDIATILGGEPDVITFVPSTRGVAPEQQPLRRALGLVAPMNDRLQILARHVPGRTIGRREYAPDVFAADAAARGRRIVLIEDTWVTGSRAVSVAGALYDGGAESVVMMPIARMVEPGSSYFPPDLPYFRWMGEAYDLERWPL